MGTSRAPSVSAGLGAFVAHITFWVLLGYGWLSEELRWRGVLTFLLLWVTGYVGLSASPLLAGMFFSYVALLDVVLVFVVLKRDVRIT